MLRQFERMLQSLTCRGSFYDGGQVQDRQWDLIDVSQCKRLLSSSLEWQLMAWQQACMRHPCTLRLHHHHRLTL